MPQSGRGGLGAVTGASAIGPAKVPPLGEGRLFSRLIDADEGDVGGEDQLLVDFLMDWIAREIAAGKTP